jgi:hypothetical protein
MGVGQVGRPTGPRAGYCPVPTPSRPGRRPRGRRRSPRRGPGSQGHGPKVAGAAGTTHGGRPGNGGAGGDRPASVDGSGSHAGRAPGSGTGSPSRRPRRGALAGLSRFGLLVRRFVEQLGKRPWVNAVRCAGRAAVPPPGIGRPRGSLEGRPAGPRPRSRLARGSGPDEPVARDRPVDDRGNRDAGFGGPRRISRHRPRRPPRCRSGGPPGKLRCVVGTGREVAAVACLRCSVPMGTAGPSDQPFPAVGRARHTRGVA